MAYFIEGRSAGTYAMTTTNGAVPCPSSTCYGHGLTFTISRDSTATRRGLRELFHIRPTVCTVSTDYMASPTSIRIFRCRTGIAVGTTAAGGGRW